ncbi:MAG: hypothetical protein ACK5LK_11350 [Chthoniobacterales bacterium]
MSDTISQGQDSQDTELHKEILKTLHERERIVRDREHYTRDQNGHMLKLMDCTRDLNLLAQKLPESTDPQLRHFLDRQSYEKAIHWLEERY